MASSLSRARRPTAALLTSLALIVASLLAPSPPARALSLAAMSLAEMTQHAALVVRGRCIDRRVVRGAGGRIESRARFEVVETAKGSPPGVVTVRQLGGTLDDATLEVPGAPLSEPGDEAILFLEPGDDEAMRVVGLALGYMPVAVLPGAGSAVRVSRVLGAEFASGGVRPARDVLQRVREIDAAAGGGR